MKKIFNTILFWRYWARKIDKPLLTDEDLDAIEKELHIHEPATYQLKRKNMNKRKPC